MERTGTTAQVKRTSSDQRKLRSRDAARCRRSQETEVFYELARTLPLPRRISTHLDKAAIMRVTLSFLRMHHLLHPAGEEKKKEEEKEEKEEKEEEGEEEEGGDPMDTFYPQVLAGFIMVMTEEGDIIYLTENISRHIGITQLEILGQSVYDFVHPCDQEELRDLLTSRPGSSKKSPYPYTDQKSFFMRMKSTLTSRGRTVNIKSATWKVFHCTGHMRTHGSPTAPPAGRVMTLLCEPIPHPSSVEFPLDTSTFLTRHSMDLRFTHCEGRVMELLGYESGDLIGRSVFEFHHALDSNHVNKSLHTLLSKGQVRTANYRFLANNGGFVWAETQATVLYGSRTLQPEAIVCLNFVLSAVEQADVVFSMEQTSGKCQCPVDSRATSPVLEDGRISDDSSVAEDAAVSEGDGEDKLLTLAPDARDTIVPLTGGFVDLSFSSSRSLDAIPDNPRDLCTPQLRQLLSPIFNPEAPPPSSHPSPLEDSSDPKVMDTSSVEKFFSLRSEDGEAKPCGTLQESEEMDLDMLAPYISMDDDFQLNFLGGLSEEASRPPPSSPPPPKDTLAINRKRTRHSDNNEALQPVRDKRLKHHPPSVREQLLLSQGLLECLEDGILDSGPKGKSHLLTDRDPVLGGIQGLCDTAALMQDIFLSQPPGPSLPFSLMT